MGVQGRQDLVRGVLVLGKPGEPGGRGIASFYFADSAKLHRQPLTCRGTTYVIAHWSRADGSSFAWVYYVRERVRNFAMMLEIYTPMPMHCTQAGHPEHG
jgi:hypothetical protein